MTTFDSDYRGSMNLARFFLGAKKLAEIAGSILRPPPAVSVTPMIFRKGRPKAKIEIATVS